MHDPWHRALAKNIYGQLFPKVLVVSENLKDILKNKFSLKKGLLYSYPLCFLLKF